MTRLICLAFAATAPGGVHCSMTKLRFICGLVWEVSDKML